MTLIIKTDNQYIPLFEELTRAIGASLEINQDEEADSEEAVLDRIERSFRQVQAAERGEVKLQTLEELLNSV
jgi:hypothetical protein